MINFPAIFIANGTAILLLSLILSSTKTPHRHELLDEKIYFGLVILNIVQCAIETVVFLMDGKMIYGFHTLLVVLNVLLFMNNIIFAYSWAIYADYKLFADLQRTKRVAPKIAIPAIIIIIGCLINLVTPVFFSIDQNNIYHRTGLFVIPYAVTYAYLAHGVVFIYSYRKKVKRYLFLPALQFMVPILIGSLLQFFFYGYSLVWLGVSIGMTSLFINIQNEASYVDVLSGLFNRQYLSKLLLTYRWKKDTADVPAAIMLDIDNFKSINDRFGHTVGDDAISAAGKILHTAVGDKGILFRYGGDEFLILMNITSQNEITDMVDIIKPQTILFNESKNKPYQISFSIGCCEYESKLESTDDFFKKLDASMYEDKKRKINDKIISC